MRTFAIPIQSFSDLVTNSSSETYVVDTDYTKKALEEALEEIHRQNIDSEWYSGDCCGIVVETFREHCDDTYMWRETDDEGKPFKDVESYLSYIWELPIKTLRNCLFVRIDQGYRYVDKFLVDNFKCIASDYGRKLNEEGRIVKD